MTRLRRVIAAVKYELRWARPTIWLMQTLVSLLPDGVGPRTRTQVYRRFGMNIGPSTLIFGPLRLGWYGEPAQHLAIGSRCFINREVFIDTTARVAIGNSVTLGHDVMLITSNHDMSLPDYRAGNVRPAPEYRAPDG